MYAQVVFGLPVEGPFDYSVPDGFDKKIKVGMRSEVNFGARKSVGYIVKIKKKSNIKNIKPLLNLLDDSAVLDKNLLLLTKEISNYYCCSWGEAIETALPESLRKGRRIPNISETKYNKKNVVPEVTLIHDLDGQARWDVYINYLKDALANNNTSIVLLPDINSVIKAKGIISSRLTCSLGVLYRKQPDELGEWLKAKEGRFDIVIGTRSAIFAPLKNLGLIVIDEEQEDIYKQDQVPHYHAREVASMRAKFEKAKLILSSASPSLESFYLAHKKKIKYQLISRRTLAPQIKIIDTGYRRIFSKPLEDLISSNLNARQKVLLFLNRTGFATSASCRNCGVVLKCPRCNINLVYHFKDNILNCHYCNFKIQPPQICPNCNSSYIRYWGIGTEKIESELSRLFPQAEIKRLDSREDKDRGDADIFISTKSIIREAVRPFDLAAVLAIDNSLNRIDFRSAEKTFALLVSLVRLTQKQLLIQTRLSHHHCFLALAQQKLDIFYDEELRQRKQLDFPPYKHLGLVKLRSEREARVRETSNRLFKKLSRYSKKNIKIISVNPSQPAQLRGRFYWQILCCAARPEDLSKFLKIRLKNFSHSGIIVTVDIDPL
jgi:primosomal protein N' (replication factor Y)